MAFGLLFTAISLASASMFLGTAHATAIGASQLTARQNYPNLTVDEIDAFTRYTWYTSAAFCVPNETLKWSCGERRTFSDDDMFLAYSIRRPM